MSQSKAALAIETLYFNEILFILSSLSSLQRGLLEKVAYILNTCFVSPTRRQVPGGQRPLFFIYFGQGSAHKVSVLMPSSPTARAVLWESTVKPSSPLMPDHKLKLRQYSGDRGSALQNFISVSCSGATSSESNEIELQLDRPFCFSEARNTSQNCTNEINVIV